MELGSNILGSAEHIRQADSAASFANDSAVFRARMSFNALYVGGLRDCLGI